LSRKPSWLSGAVARCQQTNPTLPRVTAHALRHTAASLAISAGANPKVVQRMLGHASAAMTLNVYTDLFDTDLDSVAITLDNRYSRREANITRNRVPEGGCPRQSRHRAIC
jgi:integrase